MKVVIDMQRNTVQRQIILDTLKELSCHPTVEEVYAEVQKSHPTISKTTVYRNLRVLSLEGVIHQVPLSDSAQRYDGGTTPHYHFKCRECENVFDIDINYLEDLNGVAGEKYSHRIDRHDVIFTGVCEKCDK